MFSYKPSGLIHRMASKKNFKKPYCNKDTKV